MKMIFNYVFVMLSYILLYDIKVIAREIKCPDFCKCDAIHGLRRATCQNKKLYSIEIDMPPEAEILDLSYNQISELGNNIFLEIGLSNLKLLNLSHNKVSQIHLNGFEGLTNLKTLDLSFNMMRYFTEQWFVSLNSLQELYLRGNNFNSINGEPRLNLDNLKVLDISLCGITSLQPDLLTNLPNLEILDISGNYLMNVDVELIVSLTQLNTLILNDNNFDCHHGQMQRLKNYARNKGIRYKDPCARYKKNHKSEKFQRMMEIVPQVPEKNVWIYDEEEEMVGNNRIIEVCNDGNKSQTMPTSFDAVLLEVITLSPSLTILATLILGILIGLILGCSIDCGQEIKHQAEEYVSLPDGIAPYRYRSSSVDNKIFQRQNSTGSTFRPRTRSGGSRKMIREEKNFLILNEVGLSTSTPVLSRKNYI